MGVSPQVLTELRDSDPRKRLRGIRALAAQTVELPLTERAEAVQLLGELASDTEPFIRWNVAWAAGRLGHAAALPTLRTLASDLHANVRFRVALAVALIGDNGGLPILEGLVKDPYVIGGHAVVRGFAALALGG